MKHLLSNWSEIVTKINRVRNVLLLTDYDGTLTPIVDRPRDARLPDDIKQVIRQLSVLPNCTIGIISGRSLTDIINKVDLTGIIYAGNHGMEIKELSGRVTVDPEAKKAQPIIEDLYYKLIQKLGEIKGVRVENKVFSLSVHYRLVSQETVQEISSLFEQIVNDAKTSGAVRITHGKKVFEVRPPAGMDKGKAIKRLIDEYEKEAIRKGNDLLSIYQGDDQTDEDGFRSIKEYDNSISIFVGVPPARSAAHYFLNWPNEQVIFLRMLYEQLQSVSDGQKVQ